MILSILMDFVKNANKKARSKRSKLGYSFHLIRFTLICRLNRLTNLKTLVSLSFKFNVRRRMCCSNNRIKPTPSSNAENIKKKNVKPRMFKLSYIRPINNIIAYKVIHRSSAVNNKCKAVFVLIRRLPNMKKKKMNNKFKSPKNKINY